MNFQFILGKMVLRGLNTSLIIRVGLPWWLSSKEFTDSITRLGRSLGGGSSNLFQYSCLGNPIDGGVWWATVHGVTQSQMQLTD